VRERRGEGRLGERRQGSGEMVEIEDCSDVQLFKMPSAFKGSSKPPPSETKNSILKINNLRASQVHPNNKYE